ncbi:cytochrome P450 [Suillus subaureus]|uniref:Cytochrome P450 n=1 Tax=Suillus subaureus TaxID=48587 RepID=A0A9P7DVZ6_9AGAM|nr:cytochrome P450 [Suillus subaureus]XP_041189977.1 cytochrome P450 [Suillus subaureus]KAG1804548.1 cytochrome P450 [Suillus subaureus]KAG1811378.1 cytochrome P450 [Suillus subaureus]
MLTLNVTWLDLCLAGIGVYLVKQVLNKKPASYPPGPRGWPLVGNIQDIPQIEPWLTFAEWGKKYGDISHVEVLGQHIIVLNSVKSAVDMLDKKGTMYSDRPVLPMGGELVGWKHVMALLPYGDRFHQLRKNIHQVIGNHAALNVYHPIEEIETRRFLKRVFSNPEQLQAHIRHTAGAIILQIFHGYEVKENNDPFIDLADRAVDQFSRSTAPGAFMVDIMPFLANVPEWFPGAGFKRSAREWSKTREDMAAIPYKFVKDQMAAGIASTSFTSNLLEGRTLSVEEEDVVMWSAATLYSGGADTTVSPIYAFSLAMTLFPDVQKKAQAEINAVVGPDRLPSFADRDSLPYTEALVKEVFRWSVVGPTAMSHRVTEDDIHDGYYIPKGSLVIPNIWFMLNDPQTYANPSQFNPERFLDNNGKDPELEPHKICFGFGRRICPGLHLADASVWISTVMSLAVFDISKVVEKGVEITPEVDHTSGTVSHPKPFKCFIKPRSAKAIALIQRDVNY